MYQLIAAADRDDDDDDDSTDDGTMAKTMASRPRSLAENFFFGGYTLWIA